MLKLLTPKGLWDPKLGRYVDAWTPAPPWRLIVNRGPLLVTPRQGTLRSVSQDPYNDHRAPEESI